MSDRSSKWAFIVYPDSAPDNWKNLLKSTYVRFAVSPLHSPDSITDGSGECQRKKHYHVLMDFDSLKSFDQVQRISNLVNGTIPVIIDNPSGYYQYLIHRNDPEKQQFENGYKSIEEYNGFLGEKYQGYTQKQLDLIYKEILNIIEKYNFTEYEQLIVFFRDADNDFIDYFHIARQNFSFFNTFITSRRNRQKSDNFEKRITAIEKKLQEL